MILCEFCLETGSAKARLRMPQVNNPSVGIRRRLCQGTPNLASADLQPLSRHTPPAPLTQGSLSKFAQTLFSATFQCLPCVRGGGPRKWWKGCKSPCVRRRKLPCSGGVGTAFGGGRVVQKLNSHSKFNLAVSQETI